MEAHLAKSFLERHGLKALVSRHSRYKAMAGGGYLLRTPADEAESAAALLDSAAGGVDMDEYVDPEDRSVRRCPECQSVNVHAAPLPARLLWPALLTLGLLTFFIKRDWMCGKCGCHWRA